MHRLPITVIFWLLLLPVSALAQLRVEVTAVPAYTPTNDSLFLTGTFNDWQPGDERFLLLPSASGQLAYDFLTPMPDFSFKVTRGGWSSVEGGPLADPIANREYRSNGQLRDTLRLSIASWEDMESRIRVLDTLEVRVTSLPAATPSDAGLFITGSFNGWSPRDEAYKMKADDDGTLRGKIPLRDSVTSYKITRGSWTAIESRANGLALPNRTFRLEDAGKVYATDIEIANWEDLAGPPFGIYALLLLLSALQLIILAVVLNTFRAVNPLANRLLAGLLLLIAVATLARLAAFDKDIFSRFPKLILLPDMLYFLAGPLLYLYYRVFRSGDFSLNRKDWIHLLPFVLASLFYIPLVLESDYDFTTRVVNKSIQPYFLLSAGIGWAVSVFYGWWTYRLPPSAGTRSLTRPGRRFLKVLAVATVLPLLAWTINGIVGLTNASSFLAVSSPLNDQISDVTWLLVAMLVYPLSYFLLRQPQLFRRRANQEQADSKKSVGPAMAPLPEASTHPSASPLVPQANIPAPPVDNDEPHPLRELMLNEQPYLNAGLTLAELARKAGIPAHQLSRQLNEDFGKNFFDFVNGYRITDFQDRIAAGEHQERTLLSLALEAGFNSKTAFNRAFKKQTGLTPRQYLQQADNQSK